APVPHGPPRPRRGLAPRVRRGGFSTAAPPARLRARAGPRVSAPGRLRAPRHRRVFAPAPPARLRAPPAPLPAPRHPRVFPPSRPPARFGALGVSAGGVGVASRHVLLLARTRGVVRRQVVPAPPLRPGVHAEAGARRRPARADPRGRAAQQEQLELSTSGPPG